jgi:two-component system, chemotaxis family, sensor kinase CheA
MELSDYLPMFLAEARENLQSLNLAIVEVEQCPTDGETINQIFRIAHSLKGMSATMGFAPMASLTHEMENVMEGMKTRADGLGRDALDTLFACLDMLEKMTDEIEADGVEQTDPLPLVARLATLHAAESSDAVQRDLLAPSAEVLARAAASGLVVVRVTVELAADVDMPGVRAFLALRCVEDFGDVIHATPAPDAIERGELDGAEIVLWVATDAEPAAIEESVRGVEGVGASTATPVDAAATEPAPATAAAAPLQLVTPAGDGVAPDDAPAAPVAEAAGKKKKAQTVRVEADRLDLLMHQMGELVVQRTRLEQLASTTAVPGLQQAVADLSRVAQALTQQVMQVRMVPVESVFMRFPRMVRDIATKLDKQVELKVHGEETELDRTVVESLGDPLVHLVRNSLDHGLESPDQRLAAGKPATGTLEIFAEYAGGEVVIRVQDDGRGISPEKVGKVAVERGLISAEDAADLTVEGAIELLFAPGFSTASETTDISGRGVGMDAVRTMVRNLGGDCHMTSELGQGSCSVIRLPLSLAILPALLVEIGGAVYALPLDRVEQTIRIADYKLRSVAGDKAIVLRERILPLHDLGVLLGEGERDIATSPAVVIHGRGERIGIVVDALIGQQELVTRPLPAVTDTQRALVSGGAVLGDGRIALIVDTDRIVSHAKAA